MKKKKPVVFSIFTALTLMLTTAIFTPSDADTTDAAGGALELYFFGTSMCGQCHDIKHTLLSPLERELGGRIKIRYHDIDNAMGLGLMKSLEEQRNIENQSPIALFFPETELWGFESIMANTRRLIEEYMGTPQRRMTIDAQALDTARAIELIERAFGGVTLWLVISLAAVDSVNPCAIATMIFLISFLTVQKRRRSEILIVGLSFTLAVFITYFLIMVGAFVGISQLNQFRWVSSVIKWGAVALAGTVGIISLADAVRYKISGKTESITLKLPEPVRLRINAVITKNMKGKRLIIGTFVTGFLVTLLEAVCTGQTLLPTIVAMTQAGYGPAQLTAWLYLILYCFIFVVPLLAVMIAAYYGLKWNQLAKMTQKNLTLLKVLVGVVMLALAAYLAFWLQT